MDYTTENNTAQWGILPFDPIVLIQDLLKRWLIVVLVAVFVGVNGYILTDLSYQPVYQTNTTFVVTARGSSSSVYSNLSSTTSLASVFTELLNSSLLRNTILEELELESFDGTITTAVIPDTNLITMKVTADNPWTAFVVAQSIIDHHETLTYRVVDGIVLEVLQYPVMPTSPRDVSNPMSQMKKIGAVAAVLTCVVLAAQSFFRDSIRSDKEARKKLECSFLGEIPHEKKHKTIRSWLRKRKSSILITDPLTSFRFVESVRKLRQRVELHLHDNRVLMVTSLLENEGKSTVAVNLALGMAKKQQKVLLIDCDMHKPACHAILEQKSYPHSIKDVLNGKVSASEALLQYKNTGMYMLLGRRDYAKPGDLIVSSQMEELLCWAKEHFDLVVLDMPPASATSDAESMKELADATLLVVRQNMAVAKAVNKAIGSLDGGRAKLIGCVLNNVHSTHLGSGRNYGYGRYHQYGHYGRKN